MFVPILINCTDKLKLSTVHIDYTNWLYLLYMLKKWTCLSNLLITYQLHKFELLTVFADYIYWLIYLLNILKVLTKYTQSLHLLTALNNYTRCLYSLTVFRIVFTYSTNWLFILTIHTDLLIECPNWLFYWISIMSMLNEFLTDCIYLLYILSILDTFTAKVIVNYTDRMYLLFYFSLAVLAVCTYWFYLKRHTTGQSKFVER